MTDVGNSWSHQSDNDKRYHKAQKLTENTIEGEEKSYPFFRENISQYDAQYDGDDNLAE